MHLVAVWALWQLKAPAPTTDGGIIATLQLLPAGRPAAPVLPRNPQRAMRDRASVPHPPRTSRAEAPATSSARQLPVPPAPGPVEPQPITPPLDLHLPDTAASAPPTLRSQVLNDPRVVSRPSYGQRFAHTLGTDTTLHEDRLNDGSIRLRQGTSCVILKESAAARLDPFSQTYMPAPRMAGKCPE